jgi:2,4-dienoyl-CoA reductase-like NADH-dependent reductase (Old Yellow Enzyme family)
VSGGLLFTPGRIGRVETRNRIVRAGTSETMAGPSGEITRGLTELYEALARNRVGLVFTGHLFVHPRGRYAPDQTGIDDDALLPGLRRLVERVHEHGARIFAQLAHAGSQSRVRDNEPLAPSPVPNALTGRQVGEATPAEIDEAIEAFERAASRAIEAGFDGVHIHGANGYLISEFSSPLTNRRTDEWGGTAECRDRFAVEIVRRVRESVPDDRAVTMKLGLVDTMPEGPGLELGESVHRAATLVSAGLDGLEVSCNVMHLATDSAKRYVAVDTRRALGDYLVHRVGKQPVNEAYFAPWARALRAKVNTTVVLVGGIRKRATMESLLAAGECDYVALSRPFIREPDLARKLEAGAKDVADCTSCNLCLMHEGHHSLRCWRTPRRRLLEHAGFRLSGGFKRGQTVEVR